MEKETKVLNENEMNEASFSKEKNEKSGKKVDLKNVARNVGMAAGGAAAGIGMMAAMPVGTSDEPSPDPDPQPQGIYDDMSFSEAFAAARKAQGPGGEFEWHGKLYGTYLKGERQELSEQNHESDQVDQVDSDTASIETEPEVNTIYVNVDSESSSASSSYDDYISPTEHVDDAPAEITHVYATATEVTQTHPDVHIDTEGAFPDNDGSYYATNHDDSFDSFASTDNTDGDMIIMG